MNEEKFTGKADVYAKYRPSYPDSLIDYLYSEIGFNENSLIADIGAGTGILTELLLKKKSFVYGVEPNDDMRCVAECSITKYKNYTSVKATAENTTLKSSSVDFITTAQAFHWFDRELFKHECNRILKPGGKVILIWNNRDGQSPQVIENDKVNREYCPHFTGFSGGMSGDSSDDYNDFFKDGIYKNKVFDNSLIFNEDYFIGRNLSASYAPKVTDKNYIPYITELKRLFVKYSDNGLISIPNYTHSYIGLV